jgi:fluoroquinolone resistance protein
MTFDDGTAFYEGQTFSEVDVARIGKIEFYKCHFERCRMQDAALQKTTFEQCTFTSCDMTRIAWGMSSLRGVRFTDCKLLGVNFAAANDNPDVAFESCVLRYAVFDGVHLRGASFHDVALQEASFVDSDVREAAFTACDLTRAVFRKCQMAGADFTTSTGLFFEPTQNQAKDAMIAVETAIQLARAVGLRVAGYDDAKRSAKSKR